MHDKLPTSILKQLSTPAATTAFVAVAYLVFLIVRLANHEWDASYFVTAGDAFTNAAEAPPSLHVLRNQQGHDGQFYYRLALDPFTNKVTDYGITLDLPAYRHQRLLYPLLVHALSLGKPVLIPFWMIAINYVGLCFIAWNGSRLMRSHGLHACWGLALACYPGFVLALARDFNEILAAAFAVYGLYLVSRERHGAAAAMMTLGVLARETGVLVPVAIVLSELARRARGKQGQPLTPYAAPILAGILWQLFLRYNWGHFAVSDTGTMGWPFASFLASLVDKMAFASGQQIAAFIQMLMVAGFAIAVGLSWIKSSALLHEKIAWLLYAALACIVSGNVWSEDWSFLRNLWELYAFGAIIMAATHSRLRAPLFASWAALWLFELLLRTDLHKYWS